MRSKINNQRNYGIDLLRLLSMFFILILHSLGKGGLLYNVYPNTSQYIIVWLLEIISLCAVNIFALISGYVSYSDKEKEYHYQNYFNLWFEVVFYGLLMAIIYNIIAPGVVQKIDYYYILFPVTNKLYWYFTAYTGLFFLIPFLNKLIRSLDQKSSIKLFITLIILFSIFDHFTNVFGLSNGYSLLWLIILYILGAIIKKCNIGKDLKWYHIISGILLLYLISYFSKIYLFNNPNSANFNTLISYTSPTMLGVSILYIIGFSKIKFNILMQKIIKFAAPSAFAIYLLNNQKFFWMNTMKDLFLPISNSSAFIILVSVLTFSILFVISAVLIDKIRIFIFKICHIKNLSNLIVIFIKRIFNKILVWKEGYYEK